MRLLINLVITNNLELILIRSSLHYQIIPFLQSNQATIFITNRCLNIYQRHLLYVMLCINQIKTYLLIAEEFFHTPQCWCAIDL